MQFQIILVLVVEKPLYFLFATETCLMRNFFLLLKLLYYVGKIMLFKKMNNVTTILLMPCEWNGKEPLYGLRTFSRKNKDKTRFYFSLRCNYLPQLSNRPLLASSNYPLFYFQKESHQDSTFQATFLKCQVNSFFKQEIKNS